MIVAIRNCVRCGTPFRPLDPEQVVCSDMCSLGLHGSDLPAIPDRRQMLQRRDPPSRPRTGRRGPIFVGARFVVFEWQLEQLTRMLGPLVDNFDLHEWFFTLDAKMMKSAEVIPQRDGGQWLQARTMDEAVRRGLVVASSGQDSSVGKQTSRLAQALANIKRGFQS